MEIWAAVIGCYLAIIGCYVFVFGVWRSAMGKLEDVQKAESDKRERVYKRIDQLDIRLCEKIDTLIAQVARIEGQLNRRSSGE